MKKFEVGRNFSTKIWNAAKFIEMQRENLSNDRIADSSNSESTNHSRLSSDDRHILYACDLACRKVNDLLSQYRIQDGALAVYDFFWDQLCGGYVEYVKDSPDKAVSVAVLEEVFYKALKMLHPYMPFVTEEVAHQLGYLKEGETIMLQPFPTERQQAYDSKEERANYDFVNAKREAVTALRALRAEYKVKPGDWVKVSIAVGDVFGQVASPAATGSAATGSAATSSAATGSALTEADLASLKAAMRAESIELVEPGKDLPMPSKITKLGTVYLSLEGLVDKAAEANRIAGEIAKIAGFIKGKEAKLGNANFVAHAPAAVVEEERAKLAEGKEKLAQLEKLAKLFA